jgi:ATP-dependent DNA ligase
MAKTSSRRSGVSPTMGKAWQEAVERGHEGLVAKDPASPYLGGRTLQWLKVKQPKYREGESGWKPNRKS